MTRAWMRGSLVGALVCLTAAAATAQSTGRTQTLTGTVVQVEGNTLVVQMASGEIRMFMPPASRRFLVDGRELRLSELQPGTTLTADCHGIDHDGHGPNGPEPGGEVWYAAGPTVILRLPSGENRMYTIKADDPVKFYDYNNKEMTVFDLRKDMNIKATKITEAPRTEFVTTTTVTGTGPGKAAPAAPPAAGAAPAPAAEATPPPAAAPGAEPGAAPTAEPALAPPPDAPPAETQPATPETEGGMSPLLWAGLIVLVIIIGALVFGAFRKKQ